ncbi:Oligosaccaryltransferase-domain-containing protein [Amylocarpus encephaloides]|uniref:Dolichyl-diphosphooligosaccharide--protein glycosyltransferase subunit 4 n=1 Tax=Amylocarpus encephaloides TaxID=45428 RepID=A0A9P7YSZ1_9HELO|nr:Oligosaccaryltransferase-domain-containing protein [Amylocarpus encephaloides]
MISDDDLYRLAIVLGSIAMMLIVLYHFLEVNSVEDPSPETKGKGKLQSSANGGSTTR